MFQPRPMTLTPFPVIYALRKGHEVISIGEGSNGFRLVTKQSQNGITTDDYIAIDPNTGGMTGTHCMRYCEVDSTFAVSFATPNNAPLRQNVERLLQALHGYQWGQKPVLDHQNITGAWIGGVDTFIGNILPLYDALCSKKKEWPAQLVQLGSLSKAGVQSQNGKAHLGLVWDPALSGQLQLGYYQAQKQGTIQYTNNPRILYAIT